MTSILRWSRPPAEPGWSDEGAASAVQQVDEAEKDKHEQKNKHILQVCYYMVLQHITITIYIYISISLPSIHGSPSILLALGWLRRVRTRIDTGGKRSGGANMCMHGPQAKRHSRGLEQILHHHPAPELPSISRLSSSQVTPKMENRDGKPRIHRVGSKRIIFTHGRSPLLQDGFIEAHSVWRASDGRVFC